ncbi:MAG: hypothetical protein CFE29_18120 [Bradyrhizobiaceae bacterium PARB1]|nr:MAG: hypothetical protein CFE29_18120 [Bradyrhizobiaceae bacterium PARB1]
MASSFMPLIEAIEGDQPRRRTGAKKPDGEQTEGMVHLPEVEKALEAGRAAFENVSKAFLAGRAIDRMALSQHYQALLAQQAADFAAERLAAEEREADYEDAASAAGDEVWDKDAAVEAALVRAVTAESMRDTAKATLSEAIHKHELDRVRVTAENEALQRDLAALMEEVTSLKATIDAMSGLRTENAVLTEKTATQSDQIAQVQALLRECETRHERDRSAWEAELANERERSSKREADLLAWLGKQNRSIDDASVA